MQLPVHGNIQQQCSRASPQLPTLSSTADNVLNGLRQQGACPSIGFTALYEAQDSHKAPDGLSIIVRAKRMIEQGLMKPSRSVRYAC